MSKVYKKESDFQSDLKDHIKEKFPGSIVLKNNPNLIRGIPDLLVLYKNKWAALEVKIKEDASHRPGQDIRVQRMNDMSFSSFVYPENEKEVIEKLEKVFGGTTDEF